MQSSVVQHLVVDPGDRDPREDEDWFLRLPPDVQERTRDAWKRRLEQESGRPGARVALAKRAAWESALLMGVCAALLNGFSASWLGMLMFLVGGAIAGSMLGVALALIGAGRFGCSLAGALTFTLLQATIAPPSYGPTIVLFFMGCWLMSNIYAVYGMRREFRSMPGME